MKKNKSEETRIELAINNKLAHFFSTISPASKSDNEIESLSKAIEYYHSNGIKQCIIQPKFIGSYVDVELHKNIGDSRFFSKNGCLIEHLDRNKLLEALIPIYSKMNWKDGICKYLIQAQIIPFGDVDSELINQNLNTYGKLYEEHLNFIKDSTIYDKIVSLKLSKEFDDYKQNILNLSKKEINKIYKNKKDLIITFEAVDDFNILDVNTLNKGLETFKTQVVIFGWKSENYQFIPFNLLKTYYENGDEYVNDSNIVGYCMFNLKSQNFLIIDFEKTELSEAIHYGNEFYKHICSINYGGVIIKTNEMYLENIVPMFKVRHNDYLTMVYGIDFKSNFESYWKNRSAQKDEIVSINQWKISQELLRISEKDINSENEYYKKLIRKRILEENL
jgi:hypothetical protein